MTALETGSVGRAYSPHETQPLGGHAALVAAFHGLVVAIVVAQRRSRLCLPDRVPASDLALLSVATYKLSRLIAKDRITGFFRAPFTRYQGPSERPSEVFEEPRGAGLRRAVGELLVCPYCLSQWVGTALVGTYLVQPRLARTVAALFTVVAGSDLLQEAWIAVDKRA
jgi:hypothetical protein